jgi:excisionase family DNA binding protein
MGDGEEGQMANGKINVVTLNDASLWDAGDVARYLKVSRSWVYHKAELGLLPCLRIGALLRFEPSKVREFALGRVAAGPQPVRAASPAASESPGAHERHHS